MQPGPSAPPQDFHRGAHPAPPITSNGGSVSSTSKKPFPSKTKKPFPSSNTEEAKSSTAGYEGLKAALNGMPKEQLQGSVKSTVTEPTPMATSSSPASASSLPRPASTSSNIPLGREPAISVAGFRTMRLNGRYVLNAKAVVNNYPTYWDHKGRIFMYYQLASKRWALCPRSQDGKDFLKDGQTVSIAHQTEAPGVWLEFFQDAWVKSDLLFSAISSPVPVPTICPIEKAPPAVASRGSSHQHIRRNIIARRQSVGPPGHSHVKVYSSSSVIGSLEPHIQRTLLDDHKVEEVLVSREGDTVRVSFQFRDDQPQQRAEAAVASIFPGVSGEWRSLDEAEYGRNFDRCNNHICEAKKGSRLLKFEEAAQAQIEIQEAQGNDKSSIAKSEPKDAEGSDRASRERLERKNTQGSDRSSSGSKKGSRKRKRDEKANSKKEHKEQKTAKDAEDWELTAGVQRGIKAKVAKDLENDKKAQ